MNSDVRVVLVTVPPAAGDQEATGAKIARTLVGEKLAACVNRLPGMTSVYRWQGEVCEDGEELLILKTVSGKLDALVDRVRQLHPYDVPEVLVLPVEKGLEAYLEWVRAETA